MADALMGVPYNTVYTVNSGGELYPASNMTLDEPGLVYSPTGGVIAAGGTITLYIDFQEASVAVNGVCLLGLPSLNFNGVISGYTSSANRSSNTSPNIVHNGPLWMSNKRSAPDAKLFKSFPTTTNKWWRIVITNTSGTSQPFSLWKLMLLNCLRPEDQIEVSATSGIDDRSDRRYLRSGRRVIDPTVICPVFSGKWPWLSETEAKDFFRPLSRNSGGTHPVLFVLNDEDVEWGEDDIYYGDLEKAQTLSMDDGLLYSFEFQIVSIAP